MRRAELRLGLLLLLVFLVGCSGSGLGCGGCATACGGDPNYKFKGTPLSNGVKARMTQAGFDFISKNLKPILESVLQQSGQKLDCSGAGISIGDQYVGNGPQSGGKPVKPDSNNCSTKFKLPINAYCAGSTPSSTWFYAGLQSNNFCGRIETNSLNIRLNETDNTIEVDFSIPEIQVRSKKPDIGVCVKQNFNATIAKGTACGGAVMSLENVRLRLTNLAGKVKLGFVTDPNTGQVGLKVNDIQFSTNTKFDMFVSRCSAVEIHILTVPIVNYQVKVKLGSSFCTSIVKLVVGLINSTKFLQPLLFRLLGGVIRDQLKNFDLLGVAKMEMQVPLGPLLGGLGLPGLDKASPLGMIMKPGKKLGIVRSGLNIGMDTGFEASPEHRCVPKRPVPTETPGPEPTLTGNFHLGASLSRAAANRAMWGAYHTGALCIGLSSGDVAKLSGGGFELNAGILALLAPNLTKVVPQEAPVLLKIQPTQPPRVEFGTGQKVNGVTDSTIQLQLPDFGLSFYVMLHDRYIRIFKLFVDFKLGMTLTPTPANALEITIDTDTLSLKNARIEEANLVDTTDINQILPTLVTLLTNTLGNQKISFDVDLSQQLTKALGVPITMKIDGLARDGVARDWLSLKLSLANGGQPLLPRPNTVAKLSSKPGWLKMVNGRMVPTGQVVLEVPQSLGQNDLEYQYYVDFGPWTTFQQPKNGLLTVRSPMLNMMGKHTVFLRARLKGEYRSLEDEPTTVSFTFDPMAPKVQLTQKMGRLFIDASDAVTPFPKLRYELQEGSKWKTLKTPAIQLASLGKNRNYVNVRVTDQTGNARIVRWSLQQKSVLDSSAHTTATGGTVPGPTGFACAALPGSQRQLPLALLFLLLGVPFLWRRLRLRK